MANSDIELSVKDLVRSVLPSGVKQLNLHSCLPESGLDSIRMVRLLHALENHFNTSIPPVEITPENFATPSTIAEMMRRCLNH